MSLVKTKSGKLLPKEKVKKISGNIYEIGDINKENSGECYEIDGKYYRESTGYIIFNHENNKYEIKNLELHHINGVIDINYEGNITFGNFNKKENEVFETYLIDSNNNKYPVIHKNLFKNNNKFIMNIHNDIFYHHTIYNLSNNVPENVNNDYKYSLPYSCDKHYINKYSEIYKNYDLENQNNLKNLENVIKDLSFGVEIETVKGVLNNNTCIKNGLMPLRDGSISGIEYATVPMEGIKGINYLYNGFKELKYKTIIDDSCSIHIHIGNIPREKSFILALFKMLYILQDDLYSLFPLYIKEGLGVKRKHYTKPLPLSIYSKIDNKINEKNINENFDYLFKYLSDGIPFKHFKENLDLVNYHPSDPDNNRKWQIRTRYCWANFIPLIFGNKKTVEFRLHTPTLCPDKILYFLSTISIIVNYVKHNFDTILNNKFIYDMDLKGIIYNTPKISSTFLSRLINYLDGRKVYSSRCKKQGEINYDENNIINFRKYFTECLTNKKDSFSSEYDRLLEKIRRQREELDGLTVEPEPESNNEVREESNDNIDVSDPVRTWFNTRVNQEESNTQELTSTREFSSEF